ncbi:NUDIX hydrolase [Amycolatopsis carbonis]|uniref:NUDIX hydrolase n=1 Tax=Amycolatopsis carbonis TaxID=715471 RepID=A0A9Y2IH73_9PSEU|nr:NUDIX hydrolase [Amycolatopsis sp. 2-15]WIX79216.1 NUDIX hydrolase [Amycolatopsis sp. 2-15]
MLNQLAGYMQLSPVRELRVLWYATSKAMRYSSATYKPFLEIPGGLIEDDESPLAACHREVREELRALGRLLFVDWMPTHGVWRDSLQLIFDGGTLSSEQISAIQPAEDELSRFEFLELDDAKERLRPSMARRVELASWTLLDGGAAYGEIGRQPAR